MSIVLDEHLLFDEQVHNLLTNSTVVVCVDVFISGHLRPDTFELLVDEIAGIVI